MSKPQFNIKKNMVLVRRSTKIGKPDFIRITDPSPEDNWLIRIENPEGRTTFMHKAAIPIFYKPHHLGDQGELFQKPKSWTQKIRDKMIKS